MKNKVLQFLLTFILILSLLPTTVLAERTDPPVDPQTMGASSETTPMISFEDVAVNAWYYDAVRRAVQSALMTGVSNTRFAPEEKVTRAMFITVLYRLDGSKKTEKSIKFLDVAPSSWFYDAVAWATANGIASGHSDSVFGAEDNITRQQMAVMLYRYAKYKGCRVDAAANLSTYSDASAVADWARSEMSWAIFTGLITGTGSKTLSPQGFATRSQVAAVLMSYVNGSALEKRTSDYVSEFVKGNFDNFYNASCDSLRKAAISKDALLKSWQNIASKVMPGESLGSIYAKNNVVESFLASTLFNIKVTISYDSDGRPDGYKVDIVPKDPPKPQATEKWEEVPVTVGEMKLPGMLTLPKGVEKPPVVILVQGSGNTDMNESFGTAPNSPFLDIAQGLAERGVATLRYNKRTYQYLASRCDSIEYEMLDDVSAAVKLLANDSRVNTDRIFMLGHSLGGMMAPKITADNPQLKGFISMAGSLRPLQDISRDQNQMFVQAEASLSAQQKKEAMAIIEAEIEKVRTLNDGGTGSILGMTTKWWASLHAIDSVAIVKSLKVPMLILQGSADFQIYADKDYKLWQTTLAGRDNVDFKLYDGLSHMFMPNQVPVKGGGDTSVYMAPNHVAPQVITDIASWVNKQ